MRMAADPQGVLHPLTLIQRKMVSPSRKKKAKKAKKANSSVKLEENKSIRD